MTTGTGTGSEHLVVHHYKRDRAGVAAQPVAAGVAEARIEHKKPSTDKQVYRYTY